MKVLILHPDLRAQGGVASYYKKLEKRYTQSIDHYVIGRRLDEMGGYKKIFRIINDYRKFVIKIKKENYDVIHVNPSLDPKSFLRDGIFSLLARIYNKKTIVFFHGWDRSFEEKIKNKRIWLFKLLYKKVDAFIVLADEFKIALKSFGCKQPIFLEVIVLEDDVISNYDIPSEIESRIKSEKKRILFISRITKEKGIYEAIEAISILAKKYKNIEFVVAGDGAELKNVISYVKEKSIPNVIFAGYVTGEEKYNLVNNSHLLCFPTYHGEGFPNTIVEAMAFGLPIVTRPVGGIADFFKNGEHGFATVSKNPIDFANFMEKILLDRELYRKISLCNYQYGKENFLASQAVHRLEKIYESVLSK